MARRPSAKAAASWASVARRRRTARRPRLLCGCAGRSGAARPAARGRGGHEQLCRVRAAIVVTQRETFHLRLCLAFYYTFVTRLPCLAALGPEAPAAVLRPPEFDLECHAACPCRRRG